MTVFEAWEDNEGVTFTTSENIKAHKQKGLLSPEAKLLHKVEAATYEEAMSIHHKKMGWEEYRRMNSD